MSFVKKLLSVLVLFLLITPVVRANEPKEIDSDTVVLEHEYIDGSFKLKIDSQKNQALVVYDVLELFREGKDSKKEINLKKGVHSYNISAELIGGKAAVRLVTTDGSIALVEQEKRFFEKEPSWLSVEVAAFSGASTGFLVPLVLGYYEKKKDSKEPEEIL